ncbi:uncharacterized protein LOC113683882, partial [Pocillopora damicornis]
MENGSDKVLGTGRDGTGRDGTLTEVCSHLAIDLPVVFSRAFLVDTRINRLFVCNTEISRQRSHCYVTNDGKTWTALNFQLLTVLGLDKEGNLHGVYLNGKIFLSCRQNGQGDCNVESAESWYRVRDEPETITATEVPHIAETGLDHTDVPDRHTLTLKDGLGRSWGASSRGIHLSAPLDEPVWKLVLTWRDY